MCSKIIIKVSLRFAKSKAYTESDLEFINSIDRARVLLILDVIQDPQFRRLLRSADAAGCML